MIRDIEERDFDAIAEIYNHYIRNTVITFEEEEISGRDFATRVNKVIQDGLWWLVAEENDQVVGYAYASKWSERSAYHRTTEISVYLDNHHVSKGYGTMLYAELFNRLGSGNCHIVIGGVALPNEASERLHEKFNMEKVAHFKEVGFKFGKWIDVGYWQVNLDD